jgi:anti-sigma B factor antagonist
MAALDGLDFHISRVYGEHEVVVYVYGEVDLFTAPHLFDELATAVERKGRVVIDLAGMTFIDSQGIRVLVDACTARRGLGGHGLVVRSPQPQARNVLQVSGLDKLLTLED